MPADTNTTVFERFIQMGYQVEEDIPATRMESCLHLCEERWPALVAKSCQYENCIAIVHDFDIV